MTDHNEIAQELLAEVAADPHDPAAGLWVAMAQVRATLALHGAVAEVVERLGDLSEFADLLAHSAGILASSAHDLERGLDGIASAVIDK